MSLSSTKPQFEVDVERYRAEIGTGPEVVRVEDGVKVGRFGTEQIEWLRIPGEKELIDYHTMRREMGLWVVTAAFDTEGNLLIMAQFKYGVRAVTIEFAPGGAGKPGSDFEPTPQAIIDLAQPVFTEETGYGGGEWSSLSVIYIDDNKLRNAKGDGPLAAYLLMAEGVKKFAEPKPKSTEFYQLLTVPPRDFEALLKSPYLTEASAKTCLFEAFLRRGELDWVGR